MKEIDKLSEAIKGMSSELDRADRYRFVEVLDERTLLCTPTYPGWLNRYEFAGYTWYCTDLAKALRVYLQIKSPPQYHDHG